MTRTLVIQEGWNVNNEFEVEGSLTEPWDIHTVNDAGTLYIEEVWDIGSIDTGVLAYSEVWNVDLPTDKTLEHSDTWEQEFSGTRTLTLTETWES